MDFQLTYAKSESDLLEIADMMAKVFASRSYFDFYKTRAELQTLDPWYKPEYSRIVKVAGKIVSHVSIVEKRMYYGNVEIKVAGIGDVFTHPDFRGHNFTRILMEDAIKYMEKNDFPITMLYGIMNFYHKFGYIESLIYPRITAPVKYLSALTTDKTVRPFEKKDIPALNKLYNEHFEGYTLSVKRVDKSWYPFPKPDTCFVVADKRNQPVAYVITSAPPNKKSQTFYIKEAVVFDEESAAAIACFLRDQATDLYVNTLELHQRPDTYFAEYLMDFGGEMAFHLNAEGEGGGMLRIVDIEKLFKDIQEELTLRTSSCCDAQDCIITFKTDIGSITIECKNRKIKILDKSPKGACVIKTPQNALVRLIFGYYNTERFLRRIGNPKVSEEAKSLLDIAFPQDIPYTAEPDYF